MKLASMRLSDMPLAPRLIERTARAPGDRPQPAVGLALMALSSTVSLTLLTSLVRWIA